MKHSYDASEVIRLITAADEKTQKPSVGWLGIFDCENPNYCLDICNIHGPTAPDGDYSVGFGHQRWALAHYANIVSES